MTTNQTICVNCINACYFNSNYHCKALEVQKPDTLDFVDGITIKQHTKCSEINTDGNCKYYKEMAYDNDNN